MIGLRSAFVHHDAMTHVALRPSARTAASAFRSLRTAKVMVAFSFSE